MKLQYIAIIVCLAIAGSAAAQVTRLDFSNRLIPFEVTQDGVLSGTLEARTIPPGNHLEAVLEIPEERAEEMFALLLPKSGETTVTVNGKVLDVRPEDRRSEWVYPIFSSYLNVGENEVQVEREHAASWAGTRMFSLRDGYEEAHFPWAFGLPEASDGEVGVREYAPSPLQQNYDVLWYDCTWIPRIGTAYLESGTEVIIGIRAVENLSQIELDFDLGGYPQYQGSIVIDAVDKGVGTSALSWINLPNRYYPRMRITMDRFYAAGEEFQVRVAYHGAPNPSFPKSIFGTRSAFASIIHATDGPLIYSLNQPYGARRWFPCKDHPSDKADFTTQKIIVSNSHGNLTAVSNGDLVSQTVVGGNTEFVFEHNYPIAPYLMSIAIGNYIYGGTTYTSQDGTKQMPLGAYVRPSAAWEVNGWQGTLQVMNFFADVFGEYPFIDEKYVTAAWGDTFAIEHQTCTSMPSGNLGNGLGRRNVHELAHHWFGNKVTTHDWDHTWLNEGFATYCEALFVEHAEGYNAFRDTVQTWTINAGPIINPEADAFGGAQYRRAARVLDSLRFVLGKEAFMKALKDYAAVGYTTAISQPDPNRPDVIDFQSVAEQSAGLPPGSLQQFFDQWLYSGGDVYADRPVFSYSVAYDIETSSVTFRLNQTQSGPDFEMPLQFRLVAQNNATMDVTVPANTAQHTVHLGEFVPTWFSMDPDEWMLRHAGLRFTDVVLPEAASGQNYVYNVGNAGGGSSRTVQKLPGSPNWLLVSSSGLITGTPPAPGVYPVNLRVSGGGHIMDVGYKLVVRAGVPIPPTPDVVINEVAYEARGTATDFIELKNNEDEPVDIGGWSVVLVNNQAQAYNIVGIPSGAEIPAGGYYVIGNSSAINAVFPGAVDLHMPWGDALVDTRGGVLLYTGNNIRVDGVAYRADGTWGNGPYRSDILLEGGTGRLISRGISDTALNNSLGRLPDGIDTDNNLQDFVSVPASPGAANTAGVTLPFFDDFDSGIRPEWRTAFQVPLRTATPGQFGKPGTFAPSPAGGNVLEVYDSTGGGDVNYLSGAFEQLNFEGYIWIPQYQQQGAWSTGVGINTRVDSAWFSSTAGFELPNGFYLEYQNGPEIDLVSGSIPNAPGQIRLLATDSSSVPGAGLGVMQVTVLGQQAVPNTSRWYPFRMIYDRPGNRLMASLGEIVVYDGVIPAGGFNTSGGISVGFRENHWGTISESNREGTWVDNIRLDQNVNAGSSVVDYHLY